jgi:hypothetical protein
LLDSDNYPTIIALTVPPPLSPIVVEVAGIQDLPYFYTFCSSNTYKWGPYPTLANMDIVATPVLFNPHRPPPVTASATPALSITVANGTNGTLAAVVFPIGTVTNLNIDVTSLPSITVPTDSASLSTFRSGPSPVIGSATNASSFGTAIPYATGSQTTQVFHIYKFNPLPPTSDFNGTTGMAYRLNNFIMSLQYTTPGGTPKTYETFTGYESFPYATGIYSGTTSPIVCAPPPVPNSSANITDFHQYYELTNWDPRTNRLGPTEGYNNQGLYASPDSSNPNNGHIYIYYPNVDMAYGVITLPIYWPQGGKTWLNTTNGDYANIPIRTRSSALPMVGWAPRLTSVLPILTTQPTWPHRAIPPGRSSSNGLSGRLASSATFFETRRGRR